MALVCLGSQLAAVRTLLPLHHRISADTAFAGARDVGEASIARCTPSASRGEMVEEDELCPPLKGPEGVVGGQPKRLLYFASSSPAAPHARGGELFSCGIQEPRQCWNPRYVHNPALTLTSRTTDPTAVTFVGANRLFAGLVLHHVRPRDHSGDVPDQRTGSSRNLNRGPASVPSRAARPVFTQGSVITQTASPDPPAASIETLLAELAGRRLRSLAVKKRIG